MAKYLPIQFFLPIQYLAPFLLNMLPLTQPEANKSFSQGTISPSRVLKRAMCRYPVRTPCLGTCMAAATPTSSLTFSPRLNLSTTTSIWRPPAEGKKQHNNNISKVLSSHWSLGHFSDFPQNMREGVLLSLLHNNTKIFYRRIPKRKELTTVYFERLRTLKN